MPGFPAIPRRPGLPRWLRSAASPWPTFLSGIQKDEGKQIRDIYINDTGHAAGRGQSFPNGTVSVMELWKAKTAADGSLQRGPDGLLVKDELSLIFVMAKSEGAGERVAPELRTGDWVYAGYKADGVTTGGPPVAACRTCHLQAVATDWVFRVDEYRDKHRF